jgi:fucose permease
VAACSGLQLAPAFADTLEEIMEALTGPLVVLIFCVVIITAISIYFPTIYIRKTNKLMGLLEKIESNTRK